MKKVLLFVLAFLLMGNLAFASPVNKTIIDAVTLDADPTSVNSTAVNIQDYKEVGFFLQYDETQVGNAISAAVTADISYDGTTWLDLPFFDAAGTTTMQTSETISSDGWYYFTLPSQYYPAGTIPNIRVAVAATNTDADDILVINCYLVGTK